MEYLIIGNSAAGIGTVEGIRKYDQKSNITLISDEPYHTYSRPLISYHLAGKVDDEHLKYRQDDFYSKNKIKTYLGKKVVSLDVDSKQVVLDDDQQLDFDKLMIATGGNPFFPPIKGIDKENIFSFLKLDSAKAIKQEIKNKNVKKVVILGAGLIGLKAAEGLVKKGIEVTVVELADRVLSRILDKDAASLVQSHLESKGIEFKLGDTIEKFIGEDEVRKIKLQSGSTDNCDLAIIAVGVRPNTSLVKNSDISVNRGILVNKRLETNKKDIYAAGDVTEGYDMLQGTAGLIPIWPNAYNQGLTAGINMAGGDDIYEEGFARNSIGFFGLPMITAGIIDPSVDDEDYEVKIEKLQEKNIYKKIVLRDNKIVGFIFINAIDRAGILTGLIKEQKDISDFKEKLLDDFGYLSFEKDWRIEKLYK